MNKFYGEIGYSQTVQTSPGVWQEKITAINYYGEVLRLASKRQPGENLNDNILLDNRLSIIADPFAQNHFHEMAYIEWMGTKWKISSVEVAYPRLILSLGGVYNGKTS